MRLLYGDLDLTDYPFSIEWGLDTGAPQNVTEALAFLLADGEVELSNRASNLTMQFNVIIEGPSLMATAESFAALVGESEKPLNTIALDPEDFGPVSVYDTFRASVALVRDDDWELAKIRRYSVTVKAHPFVRSINEIVTPALAASGSTTTLVDNGSATTNWTSPSGTVTVVSGAVGVTTAALSGDVTVSLTRTATIDTSVTKYLVVQYVPTVSGYAVPHSASDLHLYADGVALPRVASTVVSSALYTSTFYVAAASVAVLRADLLVREQTVKHESTPFSRVLRVDNINRTDVRPAIGSARQQLRSLALLGSAPAPGSLSVQHGTNALGDVLAYVWKRPDEGGDYLPALGQYRTSATTTDATMVSGARAAITNAGTSTYDVPLAALPWGRYLLLVRMNGSASFAGSVAWSAQTFVNATAVDTAVTGTSAPAMTTAYTVYAVGQVNLPLTDVADFSTATLRLILTNNSGGGNNLSVDEVWLFNMTLGSLVQVSCGTGSAASGGPSNRLFIDAPTVTRPRPQVLRGFAADGSDAFYAGVAAWGRPRFVPPTVNVFTVTTNTIDADVAFSYFPRWHTHAAV